MHSSRIIFFIAFLALVLQTNAQSLQSLLEGKYTFVVAKDGTGDYNTVQEAINAVPDNSSNRTVIFIKNGKYVEKITVKSSKQNLTLIGESIDSTILSWGDWAQKKEYWYKYSPTDSIFLSNNSTKEVGTQYTYSFGVAATNFVATNLCFENSAGRVGQAVAFRSYSGADKIILYHIQMYGNQDTYYAQNPGRTYVRDCFLEGNTDFIFGRGVLLVDSCVLWANADGAKYTAASTDQNWKFGYVIMNSKITGNSGISAILGRNWREYAQTVYLNCDEGSLISPIGWAQMASTYVNTFYAEYNCRGLGWAPTKRISWAKILSDDQAKRYVMDSIFAKDVNPTPFADNWKPYIDNDSILSVIKTNTFKVLDSINSIAEIATIKINGIDLAGFKSYIYSYSYNVSGNNKTPVISVTPAMIGSEVSIVQIDTIPSSAKIIVVSKNGVYKKEYTIKFNYSNSVDENVKSMRHAIKNPFNQQLEVNFTNTESASANVSIFNINGILVRNRNLTNLKPGWIKVVIDTENLLNGTYFYQIVAGEYKAKGKIIKIQ
jgi:pectinesterase